MSDSYTPTPMRKIPSERLAQRRQHLVAEAGHAGRPRRPDRRLLFVAAAAAAVVAAVGAVVTLIERP